MGSYRAEMAVSARRHMLGYGGSWRQIEPGAFDWLGPLGFAGRIPSTSL